jgi:glycosyltransferase involved in cell wall biosynthesis
MKFSVIMASRLVPYPNSCANPELKIVRAIDSVLAQTFKDFELLIIADGCGLTKEIVSGYDDKRIRLFDIKHNTLFDNRPRNTGIQNAKGEYIVYCDIDDYLGDDHLKIIAGEIGNDEWVYFNDVWFSRGQWIERVCNVHRHGGCGTSNVCHRSRMLWQRIGYAHDYYFIQQLLKNHKYRKIKTPEYYTCHIPGAYDM